MILATPLHVGLDAQIRLLGTELVLVLDERNETSILSNEVAATGDGGGGHVVAGDRVHVPCRAHHREALGQQSVLRASADYLCRGTCALLTR